MCVSVTQIERELILSAEKGSTKIPLMSSEQRTPAGPRRMPGIPLLMPRSGGGSATQMVADHPPIKQMQAWVCTYLLTTRLRKIVCGVSLCGVHFSVLVICCAQHIFRVAHSITSSAY